MGQVQRVAPHGKFLLMNEACGEMPQHGAQHNQPRHHQTQIAGLMGEQQAAQPLFDEIPDGVLLRHIAGRFCRCPAIQLRDCVEGPGQVSDDGDGASNSGPEVQGSGHGLVGMRERASILGGTLDAAPDPQGGFAVRSYLPFVSP